MRYTDKILARLKNNLEQISKLNMGQKLMVDKVTDYISIDISQVPSITRYWTGQNRDDVLTKVTDNIELCMLIISIMYDFLFLGRDSFKSKDTSRVMPDPIRIRYNDTLKNYRELIDHLRDSQKGISSLIGTYNDDPGIKNNFEELKTGIQTFLTIHVSFLKEYRDILDL